MMTGIPKPTEDELTEASVCRLKHGDVVYFTISHDEHDNEYLVAHCAVCGALRPDWTGRL